MNLSRNFSAKSPVHLIAYSRELFKQFVQPIPREKFDGKQALLAVLLVYQEYGVLSLGRDSRRRAYCVYAQWKRELFGSIYFRVYFSRREGPALVIELALRGTQRLSAAHVNDVNSVLPLPASPIQLKSGKVPMCLQQSQT